MNECQKAIALTILPQIPETASNQPKALQPTPQQQRERAKVRKAQKQARRGRAATMPPQPKLTIIEQRAKLLDDLFGKVLRKYPESELASRWATCETAIQRRTAFLDFVHIHVSTYWPPSCDLAEQLIDYYTEADAWILTAPEYTSGSQIFDARLASAKRYINAVEGAKS